MLDLPVLIPCIGPGIQSFIDPVSALIVCRILGEKEIKLLLAGLIQVCRFQLLSVKLGKCVCVLVGED